MNEAIQNAARLLDVSVESLLNFSQDTLNAMEAIMLMYDLKEEKTVMQAYKELDKLWQKEVLQDAMKDVATVIGFDYDYETLCLKLSITLDTFPTRIMKQSGRWQPLRRIFAALQQEESRRWPSRSCGCSSNS